MSTAMKKHQEPPDQINILKKRVPIQAGKRTKGSRGTVQLIKNHCLSQEAYCLELELMSVSHSSYAWA